MGTLRQSISSRQITATSASIPIAVVILGMGIFIQGTSEMMIAGLLPEMARDLGVSVSRAGLLISIFALGMIIGAPTLAILTLRWPKRKALTAFMLIFALAHVSAGIVSGFTPLLVSRFIAAFVYSGFWVVASSTAMTLVSPERRGRAMSVVAGGLTVATVIGLPIGTWIGQQFGWRVTFWMVAIATLLALVAVLAVVPEVTPGRSPNLRRELIGLAVPRLWLSYVITATATASLIGTYSYLSSMLTDTSGLQSRWIPMVMFGYGAGALIGIATGGKAADSHPFGVLAMGFVSLTVTLALTGLLAHQALAVSGLAILFGFAGFVTNPALNSRVFGIAPNAPTLVPAGNNIAFNIGIMFGPWLGGSILNAGHDYPMIPFVGAGIGVLALILLLVELRLKPATTDR